MTEVVAHLIKKWSLRAPFFSMPRKIEKLIEHKSIYVMYNKSNTISRIVEWSVI